MLVFYDSVTFKQFQEGLQVFLDRGARRIYLEDDGASYEARIYARDEEGNQDGSFFTETDYRGQFNTITLHDKLGRAIAMAGD